MGMVGRNAIGAQDQNCAPGNSTLWDVTQTGGYSRE